jgi:hypothetical protein
MGLSAGLVGLTVAHPIIQRKEANNMRQPTTWRLAFISWVINRMSKCIIELYFYNTKL